MSKVLFEELNQEIGKITLNDPDNLNAMGEDMADEFADLVSSLAKDVGNKRVLILTGAGRAFSAGGNLAMLEAKSELSQAENRRRMLKFYHSFLDILSLDLPVIAAINGHAIGAGLCVASACDLRIASEGAKLGFTFTRLGLHPGMGATFFLPRVVGEAAARELTLTGRVISAGQALELGLVSQVLPSEKVLESALAIAHEIIECGPLATGQLLRSLRPDKQQIEAALLREANAQAQNYSSAEFKEGVRATIEKRKAIWRR